MTHFRSVFSAYNMKWPSLTPEQVESEIAYFENLAHYIQYTLIPLTPHYTDKHMCADEFMDAELHSSMCYLKAVVASIKRREQPQNPTEP